MNIILANSANYQIRTRQHLGRPHIIVPVVMMLEGVHSGSHGAVLHTTEELEKTPFIWNGIPITIHHPQDGTNYISANSPGVVEKVVGRVYNVNVEDKKLKGEAWLDIAKLNEISPLALAYIRQGRPLDVSIGVFTDEDEVSGEWNGETYNAIAHNYRPDHLALLPGEEGACSWNDGCGIRTNQKGGLKMNENEAEIQTLRKADGVYIQENLMTNSLSLSRWIDIIRDKVNAMDSQTDLNYLMEVYENYFIYEQRVKTGTMESGPSTTSILKQAYSIAGEVITLLGEPVAVTRNISYIPIQTNINLNTNGGKTMNEAKSPCCLKKVNALIANTATSFTEADREWLQGQEENVLDKLKPVEIVPEIPQVNKAQALEVLRESIKTPEDFVSLLPTDMQDQFRSGLTLHKANRQKLVLAIMANSKKDSWTEAELQNMQTSMLEKLNNSFVAPVIDYSAANGANIQANQNSQDALLPAGVV